jgi:sugar phosphate isomerase/epimerase
VTRSIDHAMAQLCFNTFNNSAWFGIDANLPGQIDAAAQAGFTLFGPDSFSLEQWVANGHRVQELADQLHERGMRCYEIAALNIGERTQTLAEARAIAAHAAILHPDWILTNVGAPIDASLCAVFDEVCDVLAVEGCRPAIEYLPFTPACSIGTSQLLVDHVGRDRAKILFDTWHHFRGPDTYDELEAAPIDLVAYVQFDDARPVISSDLVDETINRRTFPGEGEFDLDGYVRRMRQKGFDGVVSVEVLDPQWRGGDLREFARRAYASSARYWL